MSTEQCPYFFYGNCTFDDLTRDICDRYDCPLIKGKEG